MEIEKSVRVGTVMIRKHKAPIYCDIKYIEGELTISGVIGPRPNGDAWGSCGQINMDFDAEGKYKPYAEAEPQEIIFAEGWNAEKWKRFLEIWKLWHLNGMRTGCVHQEDHIREFGTYEPICPKCGYKYGYAWMYERIPDAVKDFLNDLPKAWKKSPWTTD